MKFLREFKEFAVKGNMLDMAVGIMIWWAFGTIVRSLVDDVLMPIISGLFQLPNFWNLFIVMSGEGSFETVAEAREAGVSVLAYGSFINAVIAFLIVAWVMFLIIKAYNHMTKPAKKEKKAEKPKGPTEVELLMEIRDSLKAGNSSK